MSDAPLISFYVIACNQERFIREAVRGALAQTWTPLEVVLSDDCSDDATFTIMEKMAADYSGPHRIVLNRNENRLGVGAHINRILELCTGEWIVASAGDDVSLPERAARLYKEWLSDACLAGLIYSNLVEIREDGSDWYARDFRKEAPRGESRWDYRLKLCGSPPPVHGAAFAYPRRTFDAFGPLREGIVFEDNVLNWRAELSGGVLLCPDFLVRHRNHSGQITNLYSKEALLQACCRRHALARSDVVSRRQNLLDAGIAMKLGLIDGAVYSELEVRLTAQLKSEIENYELSWGRLGTRWRLFLHHFPTVFRSRRLTRVLFATLPRPLYLFALRALARLKGTVCARS